MNPFKTSSTSDNTAYELLPSESEPSAGSQQERGQRRRKRLTFRRAFSSRIIACSILSLLALIIIYRVSSHTSSPPPESPTPEFGAETPEFDADASHGHPPGSDEVLQPPPSDPPDSDLALEEENLTVPARPPPLYEVYKERERHFPQHNLSLPAPEGAQAKFLWFDNHGENFGWGNYMQEMVLNAYLAYAAKRAYVFDNYTWARTGPEISTFHTTGKEIPARIPLSAIISGPIIGGPMPIHDRAVVPRAVHREWYLSVCPESERVVLDTRKIQDTLPANATLSEIVERWVAVLGAISSRCVELWWNSPALFSYEITNTERVLDAFPALSRSPVLSDFGWSPLILAGFQNNSQHFAALASSGSSTTAIEPSSSSSLNSTSTTTDTSPLRGLLALHIRRGDYEIWCPEAYKSAMSYTGFNSFPALPEHFAPFLPNGTQVSEEEMRRHCLPDVQEIVERVVAVAAVGAGDKLDDIDRPVVEGGIRRVYVMTNAKGPWLAELRAALEAAMPGVGVSTSRDLELSWEGQYVGEALDMYVAQRAERFIGNGFSSLTSNVVLLRMHSSELDPLDTHFW
ncbi:hypothetical protein C8R43DRAFT_153314 [Mycena crocata]|nr:hypothetical protein C8R43DRAFT_153314 [Mycena crocata]